MLLSTLPNHLPRIFLLGLSVVLATQAAAQSGNLDPSFGNAGKVFVHFDFGGTLADLGSDVALQSDGKIVVVGNVDTSSGGPDFGIARLSPSGGLDSTFGAAGRVGVAFNLGQLNFDLATAVAVQPDGKIVVGGYVSSPALGDFDVAVVRLLPNGSLDPSFSGDGKVVVPLALGGDGFDAVDDMLIQPDGKIVLVGRFDVLSGHACGIVRLTSTGELDTGFDGFGWTVLGWNTSGTDNDCEAVALQPDGKLLVAGTSASSVLGNNTGVARLNTNGSLDSSFGGDGLVEVDLGGHGTDFERLKDMALLPDGRVLLAGYAYPTTDPLAEDFAVARLLSNGTLDTSFSGDGKTLVAVGDSRDFAMRVAPRPSGEIVVAGVSRLGGPDADFSVVQLLPDGSIDGSFGSGGKVIVPFDAGQSNDDNLRGLALRPTGELVLVGSSQRSSPGDWDFGIAQLLGNPTIFADGFESGNLSAWALSVP